MPVDAMLTKKVVDDGETNLSPPLRLVRPSVGSDSPSPAGRGRRLFPLRGYSMPAKGLYAILAFSPLNTLGTSTPLVPTP